MKQTFTLLIALAASWSAIAQDIKGKVLDDKDNPMPGANVILLQAQDSSEVKYSFAEEDGTYLFEGIAAGKYIVRADDYVGNRFYSPSFDFSGTTTHEVGAIQTGDQKQELEGVTVIARRPIVELQADKTVFNIDSTINAVGQNGLDLMRKSPGVLVDKDENITMSGKNGVRLYIDGRPSPLTGSELSEYLKTIQSSSIDAIEIITSPSAKYDAQGNAGIINIRLKKNNLVGTNGSVNLGYAIGVFNKYNGGVNLNHRNGKFNFYGNYNINRGHHWNETHFDRNLADSSFQQDVYSISHSLSHNYKAGVDYYMSEKSVIGAGISGNARDMNSTNNNVMGIYHTPSNTLARRLLSNNSMESARSNFNTNLNYAYTDKNSGKSLLVDAEYGLYNIRTEQIQPNVYTDEAGNYLYENRYKIGAPTRIQITSGKADWEQNFLKGRLGVGAKVSFINTDNDFSFSNHTGGLYVEDSLRSNEFDYKENIQAAYAQYSRQFTGIAFTAGLRVENTTTEGQSIGLTDQSGSIQPYDSTFTNQYLHLFPSVGLTFNKNPMSQFSIAYSKRIDRPNYQDLNPFEFKMDDYSYRKGNIRLQPQITHNFSLSHSYRYMLNTKLEYSRVQDVFAELVDTSGFRLFQTKANLATQDMISLNVSFPFQYRKWSTFVNLNSYYAMFKADYGEGRTVNLDVFSFNTYAQVSYKINDWLSAEMSGWYTAPSIWQGTFRSIAMGGVDVGAQARVLQGKGTIRASVGDIFGTMKWGGYSNFVGQEVTAWGRWESTQLRLNFSYNFASGSKINTRKRETAGQDEKSRAGESGGMGQQGGGL